MHQVIADVDPLGRGHADQQTRMTQQVRRQPDRARLPVGAGHGDDRHPGRHARRVQLVDDVAGHIARLALVRLEVHAQAGRGVDLDDAARLREGARRLGDVMQAQVDPADVESDGRRRAHAHPGYRRMEDVGHVLARSAGGQVGVVAEPDHLTRSWHRRRRQALVFKVVERRLVQGDPGERPFMADPAPRVRIGPLHQGGDVEDSVASHLGDGQFGRDDPVAHHQDAVVGARNVVLDEGRAAVGADHGERAARFLGRLNDEDVPPVVTRHWLHDGPAAEPAEGRGGFRRVLNDDAFRHGNARGRHQLLGDRLVTGDVHPDDRGLLCARRPDQPPVGSIAELEECRVRQPAHRDAALPGGAGKCRGRDPQPVLLVSHGDALQFRSGGRLAAGPEGPDDGVRPAARYQFGDNGPGQFQQVASYEVLGPLVFRALNDHAEQSRLARPERLAEVHLASDEVREFQGHVFQHVPEERALAQLGQQAAWLACRAVVTGESRQGREQPLGEAGELVGLAAGEFTEIDKRHGYRLRAVDVRAAQSSQCYDTHG